MFPRMSAPIDLEQLAAREGAQVEWKRAVADFRDVVETCVAFANDFHNLGGGYVVCGAAEQVDEHGFQRIELVGLGAARLKEIAGRVLDACREQVSPPLTPLVTELPTTDPACHVLVFTVPATRHAHSYRREGRTSGDYFIREGDGASARTVVARNGVLRELLVRKQALPPWDERAAHASIDDVDPLAVRAVLQQVGMWDSTRSVEQFLAEPISALAPVLARREALTRALRPTHAALLMFGVQPQRHDLIPSAVVVFSVYPGVDRSEQHAERHELVGTVFEQARRLRELLATQNYGVTDKTQAVPNIQKYPERALHEAVVNALVHRDYEDREPVRVTVFSDRIEIHSPGALPTGIDPDDFRQGRSAPRWRNRSLAFFCNRMQLSQAEGQGIPTILRSMRSGGSPDPKFVLGERSVTCVLPAHPRHAVMRELLEIEREVMLGAHDEAAAKLRQLLARDPYNERAIELFCNVCVLARTPERLAEWVRSSKILPERLSASTQIELAEALSSDESLDAATAELVAHLQTLASEGHLQEDHALRLVASLRRLERHDRAVAVLDRLMANNPSLRASASLWRHRGEAHIDLAKACTRTSAKKVSPRLRARARAERDEHLTAAEQDLRTAQRLARSDREREPIERDLRYLASLRSRR